MKKERKGQGSKLNRSEIVQFRLDPRLRFAVELMAKDEHRTVSSFIEKLVDQAIDTHTITLLKTLEEIQAEQGGVSVNDMQANTDMSRKSVTLAEALKQLWHIDEAHRFVLMAFFAPHLLTYEEELLWAFISKIDYYWTHYYVTAVDTNGKSLGKMLTRIFDPSGVVWERLNEHWQLLKNGQADVVLESLKSEDGTFKEGKIVANPDGDSEQVILYRSTTGIVGVEKNESINK